MLARVLIRIGLSKRVEPKGSASEISSTLVDSVDIIIVGMADHLGWECRIESNLESVSQMQGASDKIIAAAPRSIWSHNSE
jgi:hypothetical protein